MTEAAQRKVSIADAVCDHLERRHGAEAELVCEFARDFFGKITPQLAHERDVDGLARTIEAAFEFVRQAPGEDVKVEVSNPEAEGWEAPVTVIRVLLGDRPFIVDTVREFLSERGLPIKHFVHPILEVRRDAEGRLVGFGNGGRAEALVHCEIVRLEGAEEREALRAEVCRRMRDVVAATDDFERMLAQLSDTVDMVEGYARRMPERAGELREVEEFLRWLAEEHFVMLGYREYSIVGDEVPTVHVDPGSGLGILRDEATSSFATGVPLSELQDELRKRVTGGPLLIISKTNAVSTVHRRGRMDYVGVKKLSEAGAVVGERRFLGLFTSRAYAEDAEEIPILRDKLRALLESSEAPPGSHDYKEMITIFKSMPKEELFQASLPELEQEINTILSRLFVDDVQVTLRPDALARGVSVMVILPRGKFSSEVRERIERALVRRFAGAVLNYHLALSAGDQARLHFYVSASPEAIQHVEAPEIEHEIRQIIRSWDDRLLDVLVEELGERGEQLAELYADSFSAEYRAANPPAEAMHDILVLERMRRDGDRSAITLTRAQGREEAITGASELKLYQAGERMVLSDFMPVLDHAGLRVIEVSPFVVAAPGLPDVIIYSFAVLDRNNDPVPLELADTLSEALLAVGARQTSDDPFNALGLAAGLRWREIDVLRAYANYAFQIGAVPTRLGTARALVRYPSVARLLIGYFQARFDAENPAARGEAGRAETMRILKDAVLGELERVSTLADDRALRRLLGLFEGTVRTNFFRRGGLEPEASEGEAPYVSLKIRCADVEELRRNRLLYEVYVFSAHMEGIHLRAAPVSRGGIRWSDRPDDFRTEIMGLVQTQVVKNAVIIPSGSKGGFVTKRSFGDRERMMREAELQYRTLMRGLLDITDNLVDGRVEPPPGVIRYDEDDPYLVVAADKGTAHLSDVANEVAAEYGYWLGDAFASGGTHGYDHKAEGITARGAWECVRRHFRERDKDIQSEPFTVVGVGDMSGDVFGNGMLLSRQIRLIAAFDHRHIFIDPAPDLERSYLERERLFRLPRSSWEDYDRSVLSPGAMVVPRASKEIALTPEARRALGLGEEMDRLDGEALVRAVLRAPVELLWNGGIGTYVKDADETHAEVGDPANDPVRIDAHELRAKVIGEGGNLGLTQRARIRYALRGGRINTDALDNSGGVDMSDHEVNLKILLQPLVRSKELSFEDRNRLLAEMTDEVSQLVLENNRHQSLAISLDEARSRESLRDFAALISSFERDRLLERGSEGIPGADEIQDRVEEGLGLTRPTLCVLLAYAKMHATSQLLGSSLPDDAAAQEYLVEYLPARAVEAAGPDHLRGHPLRREIIATYLISDLVDLMGSSFLHRVARDTGRRMDEVVWAWYIASELAGAAEIRADLQRLDIDRIYPSDVVYRWLFGLARVLERTTRWMLNNVEPNAAPAAVIAEHIDGLAQLRKAFADVVTGVDRALFESRLNELVELGAEPAFAARLITLRFLPELLDTVRIAREAGTDPVETATAYYQVSEHLAVPWLQQSLRETSAGNMWETRLSQALLTQVARSHRAIARRVLTAHVESGASIEACIADHENSRPREAEVYRELVQSLRDDETAPLAGYAVAVRALTELAEV